MNKFIYKIGFLAFLALSLAACTSEFDDINTNPNAPTEVNSSLLLPQIERDMINSLLGEAWGIGNVVIQHTAKNQFVNEDRYLWGDISSIWNNVYDNTRDANIIIAQSEKLGQNNYKGIAMVLRAWMFTLATDAYGDIPYSEAMRGAEGISYPAYDNQEDVYNGILRELKEANDLLGSTNEVVAGDIIYGGSISKWKKLANSLRIRALMRISAKRNVSADLASIVNNAASNPLFESAADNATYAYLAASPDQFPNYTNRIGSFNEFRASKTLLDTLVAFNDPRLSIYFRPTPATEGSATPVYVGIPNGMADVEALQYNGGPQNQSRIGPIYFEDAVSVNGLKIARGVIMTYGELQFLLAEAAEKGLISGDAATYYTNGIKGTFAFYGLTPSDTYLNQAGVAYTGTSTEKINKIGLQRWMGFYYQGLEAWFDWRRTNIPALKPAISNQTNGIIPVRFRYPLNEQSVNEDNYNAAVARQGADEITTKMWLLK